MWSKYSGNLGFKSWILIFKNVIFIYSNDCPLEMTKDSFDFMLKALLRKSLFNLKISGVTDWTTNSYNTCIVQYLRK